MPAIHKSEASLDFVCIEQQAVSSRLSDLRDWIYTYEIRMTACGLLKGGLSVNHRNILCHTMAASLPRNAYFALHRLLACYHARPGPAKS